MKNEIKEYEKEANNWIADHLNSIKHSELDVSQCEERMKLVEEEIRIAKESIILSKNSIKRYKKEIRNGEFGSEYKNITLIDN